MNPNITSTIRYIGTDDRDLDLFESQYAVPEGMCYNSYVILDEKVCIMDTVDARCAEEWKENLRTALALATTCSEGYSRSVSTMAPVWSGSMCCTTR